MITIRWMDEKENKIYDKVINSTSVTISMPEMLGQPKLDVTVNYADIMVMDDTGASLGVIELEELVENRNEILREEALSKKRVKAFEKILATANCPKILECHNDCGYQEKGDIWRCKVEWDINNFCVRGFFEVEFKPISAKHKKYRWGSY